MAKSFIEFEFTGPTTSYTVSGQYDATKTMLGDLIIQHSGVAASDNWAGPFANAVARPVEQAVAIPGIYPFQISYGSGLHWIFLADNATATTSRRISAYTFDLNTFSFTWKGSVQLILTAAAGNHTVRGFRATYDTYASGTVSNSSTTITGTNTAWDTAGYAVGARIGFGSTDPQQISTWYNITTINSDTELVIDSDPGTISGASFVIEELRMILATTGSINANEGLFVAKGLSFDTFAQGMGVATVIPAASNKDNIQAVYWLADAATATTTDAMGIGIADKISDTEHYIYYADRNSTSTLTVYKFNLRAALTVASGKSTSAFVLKTGSNTALATLSQTNSCRFFTVQHGTAAGEPSLFLASTTRIWRIPEAKITDGSTNIISEAMNEIPPGGTLTFAVTNAMSSVEYMASTDSLVISTTGSAGVRSYITKFYTGGENFDRIFLLDNKQYNNSSSDSGVPIFPSISSVQLTCIVEDGIGYFARVGTNSTINQLYATPIGADWDFADDTPFQYLITPKITLSTQAVRLSTLYVNSSRSIGSDAFGVPPLTYKTYIRTTGIDDNSGGWTMVDDLGDLTGMTASDIQIMFKFKTIGSTMVPARIYSIGISYEDITTDSHYEPSVVHTDVANNVFAWRQKTAWSTTIPDLEITLTNASTGSTVLNDSVTSSASGTWEYSTDGSVWNSWSSSADTVGNYIRYTAGSLPDAIVVRAVLTQV